MRLRLSESQQGFSTLEVLVVIAIIAVILAMAIFNFSNILPNAKANAAMDHVLYRLREARQQAISHRREVAVTFVGTNSMIISEIWLTGAPPPPVIYTWEGNAQYTLFAGLPDTPEGFGNGAPIFFANQAGGPPTMKFTSTGAFIDGGNNFVNGTVFLGIAGRSLTARAITILGATGRVRQYHWDGNQWRQ